MVRRIAAVLLMGPELDSNYAAVKIDTYFWPRAVKPERPIMPPDDSAESQSSASDG